MKVEAIETKNVNVEISDDEIYRITMATIMQVFDLPEGAEIRDGELFRTWLENFAPYDLEQLSAFVRKATADDIISCAVLQKLIENQP